MIGREDSLAFSGTLRSARQWGLEHEVLTAADVRRRFPAFSPSDQDVAFYERKAGLARPEETVTAHLDLAQAHGAELHFAEGVLAWEAEGRGGNLAPPSGPSRAGKQVHPEEIAAMAEYLRPRIPTLPGRFLKAAACMHSNTPDEHFVLARHPEHPRVTVACGFSGHGFKFVPVIGEILADLATEGTTEHPISLFDPAVCASDVS
jgi:glycine/D-amino acid oxidase-like deaminating enzyme